ncbi:MAG: TetR/AcrR family transcriptional regulator [Hyphomonadaceae bacterium]
MTAEIAALAPLNDRRNEIIFRAAFEVFVERGPAAATFLDIAARARVSRETLQARFLDKDAMLCALIGWGAQRALIEVAAFRADGYGRPTRAIEALLREALAALQSPTALALYRLAMAESARAPAVGGAYHAYFRAPIVTALTRVAAGAPGLVEEAESFAEACWAALHEELARHAFAGRAEEEPGQEALDRLFHALRRLLRAYKPPPPGRKSALADLNGEASAAPAS